MNFVEQDFADRLFPFVALHPSDRRKRVPGKALQQFFESGMIIVAHEDRVMFRESLTILAERFRFVPTKARRKEILYRVYIGRIKVMEGLGALDIQVPIVGVEEFGVIQHRFECLKSFWIIDGLHR